MTTVLGCGFFDDGLVNIVCATLGLTQRVNYLQVIVFRSLGMLLQYIFTHLCQDSGYTTDWLMTLFVPRQWLHHWLIDLTVDIA